MDSGQSLQQSGQSDHDRCDSFMFRLRRIGIDIQPRDKLWSPSTSFSRTRTPQSGAHPRDLAGLVKQLFWQKKQELEAEVCELERRHAKGETVTYQDAKNALKALLPGRVSQKTHDQEAVLSSHEFTQRLRGISLYLWNLINTLIASSSRNANGSGLATPTEIQSEDESEDPSICNYATAPQSPTPSSRKRKGIMIQTQEERMKPPPFRSFQSFGDTANKIWDSLNTSRSSELTELTEPESDSQNNRECNDNHSHLSSRGIEPTSSDVRPLGLVSQVPFRSLRDSDSYTASTDRYTMDSTFKDGAVELVEKLELQLHATNEKTECVQPICGASKFKEPKRSSVLPNDSQLLPVEPEISARHYIWFRYEFARVWKSTDMSSKSVMKQVHDIYKEYHTFWKTMEETIGRKMAKPSESVWNAAFQEKHSTKKLLTMSARLEPDKSLNPELYQFILEPLKLEKGCVFQRNFSPGRFLYVNIPDPTNTGGMEAFRDWLMKEHLFLKRFWRAILIKDAKAGLGPKKKDYPYQLIFFAIRGEDLHEVTLEQFVNWFIPLQSNLGMKYLKAYARLELGECFPVNQMKLISIPRILSMRCYHRL
jgi:hypothetical protein